MNKDKEIEAACKDYYEIDKEIVKDWDNDIGILGENKNYNTYLFDFYREQDKRKFEKLLEKEGALWWKFEEIPAANVWGQLILTNRICIYIHTEELGMEVLC